MDETGLKCQVCNGTSFTKNEGFYYCLECGTQTEQIRDVEVDEKFVENKMTTKQKIKKNETLNQLELTTWECFNYYLKGLVEELINLGAKEELKLTTLQLWSAFLRKHEVAFFNTKQNQLPKLGPCYNPKDAKILYNHQMAAKKVWKGKKTEMTGRGAWKRQKRKLDKSEYEALSTSNSASKCSTSLSKLSSSTGTTGRAVRLAFTISARKHYKKRMSTNHLRKHENDSDKNLLCHKLNGNKSSLQRKIREIQLNRKTIFAILYIALNLIEDDIQLSDMIRFSHEGHLSIINIRHFFPENIAEECEKITNSREFTSRRNIFLDSQIRQHVVNLCKFIHIPELRLPNLSALVERYCKDFCLPHNIFLYAERMINLSTPQMRFRFELTNSPNYEARALAYIIFILKLLFGLDDNTENIISNSAEIINEKLDNLQINQLFVWNDWVKYIEMRKIILAQCHLTTSDKSKIYYNHNYYIEQLEKENKYTDEDVLKFKRNKVQNLNRIFEQFLADKKQSINLKEFPKTMMPQSDYLTAIFKDPPNSVYIPDFLNVDHSVKDIHTFLNPKKLKTLLKDNSINLKCVKIDCGKQNRNYFKIFSHTAEKRNFRDIGVRKVEFDIEENEWLEQIKKNDCFEKDNFLKRCKKINENHTNKNNKRIKKTLESNTKKKVQTNHLNNDNDNDTDILKPRRNLENENIFCGLSDDNLTDYDDDSNDVNLKDSNLTLQLSSLNYWILFGRIQRLTDVEFCQVKKQFPYNFLWLIETFSDYLGIAENHLYEELLTLENHFIYVLDNMENIKDMLIFKPDHDDTELARLINHHKFRW